MALNKVYAAATDDEDGITLASTEEGISRPTIHRKLAVKTTSRKSKEPRLHRLRRVIVNQYHRLSWTTRQTISVSISLAAVLYVFITVPFRIGFLYNPFDATEEERHRWTWEMSVFTPFDVLTDVVGIVEFVSFYRLWKNALTHHEEETNFEKDVKLLRDTQKSKSMKVLRHAKTSVGLRQGKAKWTLANIGRASTMYDNVMDDFLEKQSLITRNWEFALEILALLPIEMFPFALGLYDALHVAHFNKLCRVYKLRRCFSRLSKIYSDRPWVQHLSSTGIRSLVRTIGFCAGACHWVACGYMLIAHAECDVSLMKCDPNIETSWVVRDQLFGASVTRKYGRTLYWESRTMVLLGYDDVTPVSNGETIYGILVQLTGALFSSSMLATFPFIFRFRNARNAAYSAHVDNAREYMHSKNIPRAIRHQVIAYFDYAWKTHHGLDSEEALRLMPSHLYSKVTATLKAVIALLQPTPEVVEMFDDILMINEGHMVYHGPRTEILDYFEERGFTCPPRVDPADFLIEVTSGRGHRYANGSTPSKDLPVSSEDFNNLFCQSNIYKKTHETISKGFNEHQFESPEDFKKAKSVANLARSKQTSEFGLAFIPSTLLLLNRQKLVWLRDPPLLWGKLTEALIIGLVMGMIYFDVSSTYYLRMIFFSIALFQRQAWQQITISFQLRKVFYKQRPRNFFRTSSYAIAESVVQIPVNMAVSFVLGTFFYFMSGLTRTFEKYIVFYLVLLCFQHAISAYMTMLSSLAPSITIGQALAAISVSFFLLFSGNIILADLIPDYWIWMYWFSPISWALRANMLSEFSSDRYTAAQSRTLLDSFSIKQGTGYIWFGVAVLVVYYFAFTSFNALALHYIRYEKFKGVSAKAMEEESSHNVYIEVSTPSAQQGVGSSKVKGGGLPFTPTNLCIKDLDYFVTLPSGEERQLLRKITAHFEPGRMVALMGATGAGKTTLMDVIAGRKTGGRIVGDIYVNGELKDPAIFSRITAYCEQMDIHSEAASIYEAMVFSANLRLPPNFTEEERMNLVHETLELLELTSIAGEMVGSLSVEQKKRVTIGVEVVSNPSVLFLDEPTSGLDARSALIVMRGVQSIARTGRTVLCTIHQPSISIFELFDGLLLLQKGGYTAYFGELGVDSVKMLEYFASIPGTEEIRPQYNPATYMLEVIGAGIGRDVKDYSVEYKNSELCAKNRERTLEVCQVSDEFVRHSTLNYRPIATGFWNQLRALTTKQRLTYWRNPQYNFMRVFLFPIFAIIFGTTFYQLSAASVKKINSHIGLIYNSMDFIGVTNLMTVIEVTCAERAVFYRERMSNYYSPLPYSLSLFFAEIPYLIVVIILFVTIEYWLVGWNNNAGDFLFFLLVFYLYTSACTYIGQWMSALMPNEKVANVAVGAISCLLNLFSGYLLPRTAMKAGYKWFTYLIPSSYALAALVGVEFGDNQELITVTANNVSKEMTVTSYIESIYDFRPERKYNFMVGLIVIWVVVLVAIYLTFKFVSHLKR